MKTNKVNKIALLFTAALTLLYCPLVMAWGNMSIAIIEALPYAAWLYDMLLFSVFIILSSILNWICRSILSLQQPFFCALIVCGFFLNIAFVLCYDDDSTLILGTFVAVSFFMAASLLDKPIRKSLGCWCKNHSTIVTSFCCIGIILLLWAISFLILPFREDLSVESWFMDIIILVGYSSFWGRIYDIAVVCSPKPWLTRLISMVLMIGCSFAAYMATMSISITSFSKNCIIVFWTAVGLLLYDLGCFVAGRIGKKINFALEASDENVFQNNE